MHIGFDISQTGSGKAGCGYYAHALIKAILEIAPQNRYSLYPSFGDFYFDARMPLRNPYSGQHSEYGPRHLSREAAAAFWEDSGLEQSLGHPDVIHANNFWCPIQLSSTRLIYTLYDLGFAIDPTWTTEANRIGCFQGVFRSAMAADWIVAISKASRQDFLSMFPNYPQERVRVIYPCSRFADPQAAGTVPKVADTLAPHGFWLSVGTIEPRKNQRRLAEAYAACLAGGARPMPLVLAGGKGWMMEDFQSHLERLGIAERVILTGYVSDEELIWLYRNCYANLYPSLFEGFGLPVLEGMQFGAATIASNSTSLPEVTGDAAISIDPLDVDAWRDALITLSNAPQERIRLSAAASAQAARFDWKSSAGELLSLYAEARAAAKRVAS